MGEYSLGCVLKIPLEKRRAFKDRIKQNKPSIAGEHTLQPEALVGHGYLFESGRVLTVAFNGGDLDLRKDIAQWAKTWELHANIKFDFNEADSADSYREWTKNDVEKASDIRISFESTAENYGYWSAIGNDIDYVADGEAFYPANIPTMNFEDLRAHPHDKQRAFVLHEFGHAIGFLHEHQSPAGKCDSEFRWHDDEGYDPGPLDKEKGYVQDSEGRNPGIYTVMENPPYEWSRQQVDDNMKMLDPSYADPKTEFDPLSIMKYFYESWMYVKGEESHCYSAHENTVLSDLDIKAAADAYPFEEKTEKEQPDKNKQDFDRRIAAGKALSDEVPFSKKSDK